MNINLIIKSPYSFRNLVLSIFKMQSKFVLINQSLIYYALIWSFRSVDLRRYKRESKAILHILCFAHWSGPNYFFHTWHINFWKPFQCKVFPCTLKNHCCLKYLLLMLNISIASKHYCNLLSRVLKDSLLMAHYRWRNLEKLYVFFVIRDWFMELDMA